MPFAFEDLDAATRRFMLDEFESDRDGGRLYLSKHFSDQGRRDYPSICREALTAGTEETLAAALSASGMFVDRYEKRTPSGGWTTAAVPHTAPATMAEGEFNRFYLRGLCRRAIAEGVAGVEIYRARPSANARSASEAMIGQVLPPDALLRDLRENTGVDTALGLPPGPNSGLSGRLPVA